VADFGRRHVQRAHLLLELLRIVDERQQVGERNELAVVETPTHEARVVVATLLTISDDVDAGPKLGVNGQTHGVVAGRLELGFAQAPFEMLVDGLKHPARARPASHAHHRQRGDRRRRRGVGQRRGHGDLGRPVGGRRERRGRRPPSRLALGERALADEETPLLATPHERDEVIAGHPTPGREVFLDRDLRGAELQELAPLQRIDVLPDEEQEPVAAVQIAAVEPDVGLERMTVNGLHRVLSS
jgi:hypothetical protein